MIKDFYMFFGNLINNYVVLIIAFCVLIKLVSIPLKLILSKQQKEKLERDAYCRALYVKYGENKEELTDEIYKYYKSSKYNPLIYFSIKIVIVVVNVLLILLMVGTFKPISNFTNIPEQERMQIVEIYQNKESSTHYQEISLLNELDNMKEELTTNGVSNDSINTLYELRNKFSKFDVPMYKIPQIVDWDFGSFIIILALLTSFARVIPPIKQVIANRKKFKTMELDKKQKLIVSTVVSLLTFVLSISIILNTPLVVCFYFIFQYLYSLILDVIKIVIAKKNRKETSR